jgi:hypothetical protein
MRARCETNLGQEDHESPFRVCRQCRSASRKLTNLFLQKGKGKAPLVMRIARLV